MSRHRFVKAEVEGSEFYEEDGMYDDFERRFADDGGCYTYDEFIEFYGGTDEWNVAKVYESKPKETKKKKTQQQKPPPETKKNNPKNTKGSSSNNLPAAASSTESSKQKVSSTPESSSKDDSKDVLAELLSFLVGLKIDEPEYAANVMAVYNMDVNGLKKASRDTLLEVGLHPRVIDQLEAGLKSNISGGGSGIGGDITTLSVAAPASGIDHSSGGSIHAMSPTTDSLSLKDKQWRRPVRPTEAEAASLATGGGLYGKSSEVNNEKHLLSMVVVGHVDAGKSTLMGQLLVSSGVVASREARKFQKEANAIGKGSFYLAWVMDEGEDERQHGVTIEVAEKFFETKTKIIKILDAPGHADFVPQMIMGTCQADVGLLVVAAVEPEFESGFGGGGQTKEHAMLLKSLGVNQLLVAVNKMDATEPPYNKQRYDFIVEQLLDFLVNECRFKKDKIRFVPVSAFIGENVTKPPPPIPTEADDSSQLTMLGGLGEVPLTLLQAIDEFKIPPRLTAAPLRIVVSDIIKDSSKGVVVSAVVLQGSVDETQPLLLRPANDRCVVKSMMKDNLPVAFASAGDSIQMTLADLEESRVHVGNVLCSLVPVTVVGGEEVETIVPLSKKFTARISTFSALSVPLIKGTQVTLHIGSNIVEANISRLLSLLDSSGAPRKLKPRAINASTGAMVKLSLEIPLCVETQQTCKSLGRFVVRQRGVTVAAGLITEIH